MGQIKKLSTLQLRELTPKEQQKIVGGNPGSSICETIYGELFECPPGTYYILQNGQCYCAWDGSGGSYDNPLPRIYKPGCEGAGRICMPSDHCSATIAFSTMIANKIF